MFLRYLFHICATTCMIVLIGLISHTSVVQADEDIVVTATVPAGATEFNIAMTSTPAGRVFNQNEQIDYTITYGSTLDVPTNISVRAEWDLGTIAGESNPTVSILEYVSNSASTGYGGAAPVVDSVNRTITWTIPVFPANTEEEVSFSLRTRDTYTGSKQVSFSVRSALVVPGGELDSNTITELYEYRVPSATATPTATPTPSPTSIVPTATPIAKPIKQALYESITMRSISADQAVVEVIAYRPASDLKVYYGTSLDSLDQVALSSATNSKRHIVTLEGLEKNTIYYFQVKGSNQTGQVYTSDIYTFITAQTAETLRFIPGSFAASSKRIILTSPHLDQNSYPLLVLPRKVQYEFRVALEKQSVLKNAVAYLLSSNGKEGVNSTLRELEDGSLVGVMEAPNEVGFYELYGRVMSQEGTIYEQKVADVRIVEPLSVASKQSGLGIEHAEVTFFSYNPSLRLYERVESQALAIENPSYTMPNGELVVALPIGRYKIEVEAFGYERQELEFKIGREEEEVYPKVRLLVSEVGLVGYLRHLHSVASDIVREFTLFLGQLGTSPRFYTLSLVIGVIVLCLITPLSYSYRAHIHWWLLPRYLWHHVMSSIFKRHAAYLVKGSVVDILSDSPVSRAYVRLMNGNQVLAETTTSRFGEFFFATPLNGAHVLEVSKKGYSVAYLPYHASELTWKISIQRTHSFAKTLWQGVSGSFEQLLGFLFELFLVFSVIFVFFFSQSFGVAATLPLILVLVFNLLLGAIYLKNLYHLGRT